MNERTALINGIKVISTTEIQRRFGLQVNSNVIRDLGLTPFYEGHPGVYWREDHLPMIACLLAQKLMNIALLELVPQQGEAN